MRVGPETRKLNQSQEIINIIFALFFFPRENMVSFNILLSNPFPRFNIIIRVPSQNHTFLSSEMWKGYLYSELGRRKEVLILCILQEQVPGRAEQSDRAVCQPGGLLSEKLQNRFLPAILHSRKSPASTAHGWACGFHRPLLEKPQDSEVAQTPTFH